VYAAAEAAVIGMCKGGARDLAPYGITVNVIAPGPVDTEIMGGRLTDERRALHVRRHSAHTRRQPDEIAATVAFLLSEGGGYLKGATVQVDGGKHMH
jgi:NAD(P)-dependent dehydrogenase (short-subunit alcohol dehydrogenase family)